MSSTSQGGNDMRRTTTTAAMLAAAAALVAPAAHAGTKQFLASAHENGDGTVTLPLRTGLVGSETVYYVIFDTSSNNREKDLGVNRSRKLSMRPARPPPSACGATRPA